MEVAWLSHENLGKSKLSEILQAVSGGGKRDKIALELLSTEQSYVRALTILLHLWKIPLKEKQKEMGISDEQIIGIFGNLEEIINVNTILLGSLFEKFKQWNSDQNISSVLASLIPFLKIYKQYAINYHPSTKILEKLKKKDKFKLFSEEVAENPLLNGLDLGAYLIMPVQRIPRYVLLMTELLKNTPEDHSDFAGLMKILEQMREIAEYINLAPQLAEESERTFNVVKKFERYKEYSSLLAPNRFYIMDGDLQEIVGGENPKNRHFFIFTDMILLAALKSGKWVIKHQFFGEFSAVDDPNQPNAFRLNLGPKSFHLVAADAEEKKKWVDAVSKMKSASAGGGAASAAAGGGSTAGGIPISDVKDCSLCLKKFGKNGLVPQRCEGCGNVFCQLCSSNTIKAIPHCDTCYNKINAETQAGIFIINFSDGNRRAIQYRPDEVLYEELRRLCSKYQINFDLCCVLDGNNKPSPNINPTTKMSHVPSKLVTIILPPEVSSIPCGPSDYILPSLSDQSYDNEEQSNTPDVKSPLTQSNRVSTQSPARRPTLSIKKTSSVRFTQDGSPPPSPSSTSIFSPKRADSKSKKSLNDSKEKETQQGVLLSQANSVGKLDSFRRDSDGEVNGKSRSRGSFASSVQKSDNDLRSSKKKEDPTTPTRRLARRSSSKGKFSTEAVGKKQSSNDIAQSPTEEPVSNSSRKRMGRTTSTGVLNKKINL